MSSPTATELQKSLDDFSTTAKGQIAEVGKKAQEAYDDLRNHVDGQNALSAKGLKESIDTQKKLQDTLDSCETKQTDLHKQLEDMHKAVSRIAAGGSAANDKTYVRAKSNIVALEDYHKATHHVRGGTESYLSIDKSDDEIAYEKGFFKNLANEASKSDLQKLQRTLTEAKSLIVSDLTSAGFYVPQAVQGRIIDKQFETSPMLQEAEVTNLASGNTLEHIVDRDEFSFQLLDEITTPASNDLNKLQLLKLEAFESVTRVSVSRRALQDAGIDMSAYVAAKAGDKMARGFNNLYVNGTGGSEPQGILNTPITADDDETRPFGTLQQFVTGSSTGFDLSAKTSDNIIDMVFSIKTRYEANAKFFTNKFTMGEIRKLKDGQGDYIWQPDFTKLASSTLVGYPIIRFEDMPGLAMNTRSILFGDMRQAYHVVNRLGIMSVVDDLSDDRFVIYKFFQRSGGRPTDSEAMRVMSTSA